MTAAAEPDSDHPELDRIRVLHVDDDPEFVELTAEFLAGEDDRIEVVTETSATDGLDRVDGGGIDCIVSDHRMPGMDGLEFLAAVRETRPDLPFLVFTGEGSEAVASDAIAGGATDYLRKGSGPEQYELLANRVRNAVERHRNRRMLYRERIRRSALFENTPDPVVEIVVTDDAPTIEAVNAAFEDVFGTDAEAAIGRPVHEVVGSEEGSGEEGTIFERAHRGEGVETEVRRRTATGVRDFILRVVPVDASGASTRAYGWYTDITEQKERQRELEQFKTICESLQDGIYVFDEDYRLAYCNESYASMKGRPREELLGRHLADIGGEDVFERGRRLREEMIAGERESAVIEYDLRTLDGDVITAETRFVPLPYDDAFRGTTGVIRDVTDRKERERELERQNERLEEFAGIVSHDLRNPLQVADGRLELAREECDSEQLDAVEDAHDRMYALIDDLLALARAGESSNDVEPVDLGTTVERCWRNVETTTVTLDTRTERTVLADESRLQQLLENLVRNAVEHTSTSNRTPSGDAVEHTSTSNRTPSGDAVEHTSSGRDAERHEPVERGGEGVTVTVGELDDRQGFYVEDDGPGIPEEDRNRVFEPGYSTVHGGTGLGLSIVREIVDAHDWEIRVTEGTRGGARFEITGVDAVREPPNRRR